MSELNIRPKKVKKLDSPFVDRESFFDRVTPICYRNYRNRNVEDKSNKEHTFILISGASGIGKTRSGREISTIPKDFLVKYSNGDNRFVEAMQDPIYCYIRLQHDLQEYDGSESPEIRTGVRVAISQAERYSDINFRNLPLSNRYKFRNVIKKLLEGREEKVTPIVIHFDSFRSYIEECYYRIKYCENRKEALNGAKSIFMELFSPIGAFMKGFDEERDGIDRDKVFIIPVITGAASSDVSLSTPKIDSLEIIVLEPLNMNVCSEMLNYYLTIDKIDLKNQYDILKILIGDTGYIPGDIETILSNFGVISDKSSFNTFNRICEDYTSWYSSLEFRNKRIILDKLFQLSITQEPIDLSYILLEENDNKYTIEDLRRIGLGHLIPVSSKYTVYMPFMMFYWINEEINVIPNQKVDLFIPTVKNPWTWKNFVVIFPYIHIGLINSLNSLHGFISLQSIFRGSSGIDNIPKTIFQLTSPLEVLIELATDILSNHTKILDIHSSICICSKPNIFKCDKYTADLVEYRFYLTSVERNFLVLVHCKQSDLPVNGENVNLSQSNIVEWYTKLISLLFSKPYIQPNESVILVYFTNGIIDDPQKELHSFDIYLSNNHHNNIHLLLFHKDNLDQFLSSTFSHRALI
ncbi:hypothetical protein DLAC_01341 [Tieghemostelium lacteum]|uniref:Uncharacterized protein n=1 Tax=Tieghemostelium lacteum TaxID=361077 RepID=A0A152A8R5_TIELA|nr:hypothetical protein DLAC_01341 [Tieghemostelium lacteum]|eukprot:KYR02495.1 hypothetical protein DLAC_01341 [Tieghemostelium lacteum]